MSVIEDSQIPMLKANLQRQMRGWNISLSRPLETLNTEMWSDLILMGFSQPVKQKHVASLMSRSELQQKVAEVFLACIIPATAATEALKMPNMGTQPTNKGKQSIQQRQETPVLFWRNLAVVKSSVLKAQVRAASITVVMVYSCVMLQAAGKKSCNCTFCVCYPGKCSHLQS